MPVDDEKFESITHAQWLWYFYNFMEDEEEKFIEKRDLVEYNASFIEPEAVRKIRESREKKVTVSDKDFNKVVENMFGRPAPKFGSK